jgi:predicted Zn-dependent peptidase
VEAAVDEIVRQFIAEGPSAEEIQKAASGAELGFLRGLESNLGKANQLLEGATYSNDPGYFKTEYRKRLSVTAADVRRAAAEYLTRERIVLSVVPLGGREQASHPDQSRPVGGVAIESSGDQ